MTMLEVFKSFNLDNINIIPAEKMNAFNAYYPTRVVVIDGIFGRTEGLSHILQSASRWPSDITNEIRTLSEYKIYQKARLTPTEIEGRNALIRNDINWLQRDEFGKTNLQRIENGLPPLDTKNRAIELHHIGQRPNSPLAELTIDEHRLNPGNSKILHSSTTSDVHKPGNTWQAESKQHWRDRANIDMTKRQVASLEAVSKAQNAGVRGGLLAAGITGVITTVDNVRGIYNGEITVQEAAVDIALDVGTATALGYGAEFISSSVATASAGSAHKVMSTLVGMGIPAAAVSFGIASYDSVVNFAQGKINGTELAHNLGKNATSVATALHGAKVGAALGTVAAGPVGAVTGSLVGGMVGYLVAVEAYATVIEIINNSDDAWTDRAVAVAETAADLRIKAVDMGQDVLDLVSANVPETLETVKNAFNDFASTLRMPFSFA